MNEKQEYYFQRLKKYVKDKGGKVLSEEYIDSKTKMRFQCENDHIWETRPNNIVSGGHWCSKCHFDKKRNKIEDIRRLIEGKNGKVL